MTTLSSASLEDGSNEGTIPKIKDSMALISVKVIIEGFCCFLDLSASYE